MAVQTKRGQVDSVQNREEGEHVPPHQYGQGKNGIPPRHPREGGGGPSNKGRTSSKEEIMPHKDLGARLAYNRKYNEEHREEKNDKSLAYYREHRKEVLEKKRVYDAKRYAEKRDEVRAINIQSRYGLSAEEYERILAPPCSICGEEATHLDHNHATGDIRGGLCRTCNLGLGYFKDSPDLLVAAAGYLE